MSFLHGTATDATWNIDAAKPTQLPSSGEYFVTICTKGRECVLDDPVVMGIILDVWHALPGWFPTIELDAFVIMPNHAHLIVWLLSPDDVGATLAVAQDRAGARPAPTEWVIPKPAAVNMAPSLGDVMGAFKSLVFTVYLDWIEMHDPARHAKFWQRNYYEHVIRHDAELAAIRRYIQDNPLHWIEDRDNPDNVRHWPLPTKVEDYLEDIQLLIQE